MEEEAFKVRLEAGEWQMVRGVRMREEFQFHRPEAMTYWNLRLHSRVLGLPKTQTDSLTASLGRQD